MQTRSALAKRIRLLVQEEGSVPHFTKKIVVSDTAVRHWISGRNFPSAELLAAIATECSVTADWLLGLTDDAGREIRIKEELEDV